MTRIGGQAAACEHRSVQRSARRTFLKAALRGPGTVGAVAPSSPQLASVLVAVVPRTGTPTVVELGPGTGAVSGVIAQRLPPGGRHLAVELDPDLVGYLQRTHPELEVVHGDARDLTRLLAARGVRHADAVIGGLPWSLFDERTQRAVIGEVSRVIGETGAFTTFAYLHGMTLAAARQFRRILRGSFEEVLVSATVWRNVPPAFVYVCRRPTGR
ncbi:Phospholipid N-methyltransferase [Pseudonocardia thermophila]|uniref:Phospholipid N-methyltransferase n=1 Tax=Pseudonocardia thermophila TaxID=1848 RepID=A0A1M6ZB53_PSETH|nr:methyltransferase domain-containing protein [Pseudonocardia thermophila]SHL27575.1 Phospholipid N-methyltransferase [Pseudonocardia thermophila]